MEIPSAQDFSDGPRLVFYEITRACDLACRHCRAEARPKRNSQELSTCDARELILQLASFPRPPLLVFTGGDPFKREDLTELVAFACARGLIVAVTPSATALVTDRAIRNLREAGASRLAVSLDAPNAAEHDRLRGAPGSFIRTLDIIAAARKAGLSVQINTTVSRRNVHTVETMAEMLAQQDIVLWSVFFLVPVGRGILEPRLSAQECERTFERLWEQSRQQEYGIKTTEAPHYRRFVLMRKPCRKDGKIDASASRSSKTFLGLNDGKGVLFVSHIGEIYPSGFLPLRCGRFPEDSPLEVYRNSKVFRDLQNPDALRDKCGVCEFRRLCGGSRARAFAVTGDYLAAEPDCAYVPKAWLGVEASCQNCDRSFHF